MSIRYRPATTQDLKPAAEVVKEALNDLELRFGFDAITGSLDVAFPQFCLSEDPAGLWIAEDANEIVGFGFSWTAEELWFLSQLFVRPRRQSSGIGRELLTRTLQQAQSRGSPIKALITFAYNRGSLGLYMRHGLYPRLPLYVLSGRAGDLVGKPAGPRLLSFPLGKEGDAAMLRSIDRKALGLSRARHHHFLQEDASIEGFGLNEPDGEPVGYVFVSNKGKIGPIAVSREELMAPAVSAACRIAVEREAESASVFLPGICGEALQRCLDAGFRLGRTMVLLSSRPFGDWTRYAPRDPGFM
jgi:GNAT superfamily N-acetyltransferase